MIFDPLEHIKWTDETRAIDVKYIFRFWSNVDIRGDDDCWLWIAGKSIFKGGYGVFGLGNKKILTHRFSYLLANGTLPKDKLICHHCDIRLCINPNHLFLGDQNSNMIDCVSKGRNGYVKGSDSHLSTITESQVLCIIDDFINGSRQIEIAKNYKISSQIVNQIITGRTWKHLITDEQYQLIRKRRGSEAPNASRINIETVKEIREKYATGNYTQDELGRLYYVVRTQISRIVNYKEWKNV